MNHRVTLLDKAGRKVVAFDNVTETEAERVAVEWLGTAYMQNKENGRIRVFKGGDEQQTPAQLNDTELPELRQATVV